MAFEYSRFSTEMMEKLNCRVRHSTTHDEKFVTQVIDVPTKQVYYTHTADKGIDAVTATDEALKGAMDAPKPQTAGQKASDHNREKELEDEVNRLKAQLALASQTAAVEEGPTTPRKRATTSAT